MSIIQIWDRTNRVLLARLKISKSGFVGKTKDYAVFKQQNPCSNHEIHVPFEHGFWPTSLVNGT